MQEARNAKKHYFSPKLGLHASLKMVQNPSVSSSLPSLYFCLVSLGLVHGILPLAAVTDVRLGWEQSETDG